MRSEAKHNRRSPSSRRASPEGVVKRVPLLPRPHFPGWSCHPVPIALGEVSKLCAISLGEAVGDSEVASHSAPWPVTITPEPDSHLVSGSAESSGLVVGLNPSTRRVVSSMLDLCIELLSPPELVDGGLHGTDPCKATACGLSDYEARVLVRLRDVIRNPASGHL